MKLEGFPDRLVLLDTETTGGNASRDRLTEIALIIIEDGEVVETWQQLLNPQTRIPHWITNITGIDEQMVADKPTFAEIAPVLAEKLQDHTLVAHHARFDQQFLLAAFARCDLPLNNPFLCSVKLSRQFYPQHRRHGLDAQIERLGVTIKHRHRAMDDTEVILRLLEQISHDYSVAEIAAVCKKLHRQTRLPSQITQNDIQALPASPGIYQFIDENDALLYVGKSINIRQRVLSHFTAGNKRMLELNQRLNRIDTIATPTDFGAQLLENELIKSRSPRFNRRLTKQRRLFQIQPVENADGYLQLNIIEADQNHTADITQRYGLFRSKKQAKDTLAKLCSTQQLCEQLCGLAAVSRGPCFGYQLKKCRGACCGEEPSIHYNLRLQTALSALKNQTWPWPGPILVHEQSQHDTDFSHTHLIDQWVYLGQVRDHQEALTLGEEEANTSRPFDRDTYKILLRFLYRKPPAYLTIQPLISERASA